MSDSTMGRAQFMLRTFVFVAIMDCTAASINLIQYPGLLLAFFSRHVYRQYINFTQSLFGALIVLLTYLFTPVEIVVTGDHDQLDRNTMAVIMANHQIYSDWWWLWILAWHKGAHGSMKIILKQSLKYLPVFGWGMQFFEFIFLARKWAVDRAMMSRILHRSLSDRLPLWLVIFPEGTVITDNTKSKSQAYAKKMDITDQPQHVLIPKATGLFFCIKNLQPDAKNLWDVTMGYEGLTGDQTPYEVYSLSRVFFEAKGPERVHMHIQKFVVSDIPGFQEPPSPAIVNTRRDESVELSKDEARKDEERSERFTLWLRSRFLEKDALMADFYRTGSFPRDPTTTTATIDGGDAGVASSTSSSSGGKRQQEPLIIRPIPTLMDLLSLSLALGVGAWAARCLWRWWI
ncbi:hypothetical protein HKX48_009302 [Thoreauomyces humboldtii]|nr:hypothetical protein HKX48_009302 [Thoreauomyces humboldtii]